MVVGPATTARGTLPPTWTSPRRTARPVTPPVLAQPEVTTDAANRISSVVFMFNPPDQSPTQSRGQVKGRAIGVRAAPVHLPSDKLLGWRPTTCRAALRGYWLREGFRGRGMPYS